MKKLIIFDLDGTLLDTLGDLKNAVNYALNFNKWPQKSKEEVRQAIGNGVAKLIQRTVPNGISKEKYESALKTFTNYYESHYDVETKPYPGLLEMLKQLKRDGFLLAVCTNKIQVVANYLVSHFFSGLFDYVQGDEIGIPKKPEPYMIDKVLNHFSLTSREAVYVGDTEVDQQTAMNSHLEYALVEYGYRTKEELSILCPNSRTIVDSKELYSWLKTFQKNRT
jgi:phosphoglycolate phosphatase